MAPQGPVVSVIIPCHNYARFLPEAVESVARQTFTNYEIVIVNDGSTDDTECVARELITNHPDIPITLVTHENRGLPGARNSGIRRARGKYIQPLDADDKLHPEYLASLVRHLDDNPNLAFAYSGFELFGDLADIARVYDGDQNFSLPRLLNINYVTVCALFSRDAWKDVGGYRESMRHGYEDWEFYITLAEAGHLGGFVDRRLYLYRKHGSAMLLRSTKKHELLRYTIKTLHPTLYSPHLAQFSPRIANLKFYLEWKAASLTSARTHLSRYVRETFPAAHRLLKGVYRRLAGPR